MVLSLNYLPNVACWFSETNSNYLSSRAHQDDSLISMAEPHTHDIRLFGRTTILSQYWVTNTDLPILFDFIVDSKAKEAARLSG